jgi:hypothetical protein
MHQRKHSHIFKKIMACQLISDCLNDIFEHLEEDKLTLHSCLLVNRLWCKISVGVLWRNIWDFKNIYQKRPLRVASSILNTLIACLPNESKELLYKNEIFISTPTSKPPLFNYIAFCKVLSICEIGIIVNDVLGNESSINATNSLSLKDRKRLVTNEIIKMFTDQISALKKLTYIYNPFRDNNNFYFTYFSGMKTLSELRCSTNLPYNFFYQLSQVCHNLQSISIKFCDNVSNELKRLISLQKKLKNLTLISFETKFANIIPFLTKHSNTITKLCIYSDEEGVLPLSFISSFQNLQEIKFSHHIFGMYQFNDFEKLQYIYFPKLQNLKILYGCIKPEYVIKFLENNGKNLQTFYIDESNNALRLSIANFCPNLKNLSVIFQSGELNILKAILINCQYLESIKIQGAILTEKRVLETVVNYSPNNFYEIRMCNSTNTEDLESSFIILKNRVPPKLFILTAIKNHYGVNSLLSEENMKIIKKYQNLGIIKFRIKDCVEEYDDDDLYAF